MIDLTKKTVPAGEIAAAPRTRSTSGKSWMVGGALLMIVDLAAACIGAAADDLTVGVGALAAAAAATCLWCCIHLATR